MVGGTQGVCPGLDCIVRSPKGDSGTMIYKLDIGYVLPEDPDSVYEARRLESRAIDERAVALAQCQGAQADWHCGVAAETAFRRYISSIPGAEFHLAILNPNDNLAYKVLKLSPNEAVDPNIDPNFGHLMPGKWHGTGLFLDMNHWEIHNTKGQTWGGMRQTLIDKLVTSARKVASRNKF